MHLYSLESLGIGFSKAATGWRGNVNVHEHRLSPERLRQPPKLLSTDLRLAYAEKFKFYRPELGDNKTKKDPKVKASHTKIDLLKIA